ncbi:hypothetical protein NUW54_g12891 [Trametes sanguinea]|uniref:Uncharacterized protein n=1 Tax=Trametes sanguinea TaxID=158606 RepID=A0ACC1MTC3_9APHY|nr:hypothetical protein NUW54_g12891 [Trametes sanguinea]
MIQVCRAEDGTVVQLDVSLWDLERLSDLEQFLSEKSGVPQDAIWAYLSDGRPLRSDNVRDLAGVEDQTIYIFNKAYLSMDIDQVLHDLHYEPQLQPPVEGIYTTVRICIRDAQPSRRCHSFDATVSNIATGQQLPADRILASGRSQPPPQLPKLPAQRPTNYPPAHSTLHISRHI